MLNMGRLCIFIIAPPDVGIGRIGNTAPRSGREPVGAKRPAVGTGSDLRLRNASIHQPSGFANQFYKLTDAFIARQVFADPLRFPVDRIQTTIFGPIAVA